LIRIAPDIVCLPAGSALPDGMRVTLEGSALFEGSVNEEDYCVSQNTTTLSFNRPGSFEANFIYSYSNMRYVIPVTFRIMDENGNVPVLAASVALNARSLWLTEGEKTKLDVVFTPAEADDKMVTWVSTNPSVVRADKDGTVSALSTGQAEIICTPADSHLSPMVCPVIVEDYLTLELGEKQISLFKQGKQVNEVFSANLSEGTIQRLRKDGIVPNWNVSRTAGEAAEVEVTVSDAGDSILVTTTSLLRNGTDTYHVTCTAGTYTESMDFTVTVIDSGEIAQSIAPVQAQVNVEVGQTFTVDFSPVCTPLGTTLPADTRMWSMYAGIGRDFYDALDDDAYVENGDLVTLRFTREGRYLLSRQFFLDNLHYEQVCEIIVGGGDLPYRLLKTSEGENIVYLGGKAGKIAEVSLTDTILFDVFDNDIAWSLERVSGDSLDAILKRSTSGAAVYTVSADHEGEDIWRVTCRFGDFEESVDIPVVVKKPRGKAPDSIVLSDNHISGTMGDWLNLPIAVSCLPSGTELPETGDDFWSFEPVGMAADVCRWEIEDGILRVNFVHPGYYTGILRYEAGNYSYSMPVYVTVSDEEGVIPKPDLDLYLLNSANIVYTSAQKNTQIGYAEISRGVGAYYSGESNAYMDKHPAVWQVSVTSGTAAELSIEASESNSAKIILRNINSTGEISYRISCTVDGIEYAKTASLTVKDAADGLPNPSLIRNAFYAVVGEPVTIPTSLYERSSGTILQGSTKWTPDALLPAIGYEYTEKGDCLQMTFYKEGTYNSSVIATIGNLTYELPFTIVVGTSGDPQGNTMRLPIALTAIGDYAFEETHTDIVDLRDSQVVSIGKGAFKNCTDLSFIYIPATVEEIAPDAFDGCLNVVIVCERNSKADNYAAQNSIPVRYQ